MPACAAVSGKKDSLPIRPSKDIVAGPPARVNCKTQHIGTRRQSRIGSVPIRAVVRRKIDAAIRRGKNIRIGSPNSLDFRICEAGIARSPLYHIGGGTKNATTRGRGIEIRAP